MEELRILLDAGKRPNTSIAQLTVDEGYRFGIATDLVTNELLRDVGVLDVADVLRRNLHWREF